MPLLTLSIDMNDRLVTVVGGGEVACRKVQTLLESGARVRIVSPEIKPELREVCASGRIEWRQNGYRPEDLDGSFLVVAATADRELNRAVAEEARRRGMLVNVAAPPECGDTTLPAVLQRGGLEIAVSSGGTCPAFAVAVRDRLEREIGPEYGQALQEAAQLREKLLTERETTPYNAEAFRSHVRQLVDGIKGTQ